MRVITHRPLLLVLAGILVAQAFLLTRLRHIAPFYDEGVYLLSIDLLRHGQSLGSDVFAPQPPAFYDLFRLLATPFGESVEGLRAATVAVVLCATAGAFALGHRLVGAAGALCCAGALVIAAPLPLLGGRILADNPALALAVAAVAVAAFARGRLPFVGAAGALLVLATLVKLSAATALPTVALLVLSAGPWSARVRRLAAAAVGAAIAAAALLLPHVSAAGELWESNVSYHERARGTEQLLDPWHEVGRFFDPHLPFTWLVAAAVTLTLVRRERRSEVWALWAWAAVALVFVLTHRPLHENHLVVLSFAFALPTGVAVGSALASLRGRRVAVASVALALVLVAGYVQQLRRLDEEPTGADPRLAWAAEVLERTTAPDALVLSDQPLVPFLANRRVPGAFVDTAKLRFATGSLTDAEVIAALDGVAAVVVGRSFTERPAILAAVRERFPRRLEQDGIAVNLRR